MSKVRVGFGLGAWMAPHWGPGVGRAARVEGVAEAVGHGVGESLFREDP